jgi:hypothetical protein
MWYINFLDPYDRNKLRVALSIIRLGFLNQSTNKIGIVNKSIFEPKLFGLFLRFSRATS